MGPFEDYTERTLERGHTFPRQDCFRVVDASVELGLRYGELRKALGKQCDRCGEWTNKKGV